MYNIEKTTYGIKLTFSGIVKLEEMSIWLEESMRVLPANSKDFYVMVDMRELKPISFFVQRIIDKGQQLYKRKGMVRSVVIIDNPIIKRQLKKVAIESGIYNWERYIDATSNPDWEQKGLDWLLNAIDPDTGKQVNKTIQIKIVS